jgi:copper transport protein
VVTTLRPVRALGAVLLLLGSASLVWAHASLVRASPAADAHVALPPSELRLEFSEAVTARTSRIELVTPDSQRHVLSPRADTSDAKVLLADVPTLAMAGRYRVDWRLVGPDGHAVTGKFGFTVDSIPRAPSVATPAPQTPMAQEEVPEPSPDSFLQQSVRFLSFLSMVVVIGAVAFALFVLPVASRSGGEVVGRFRARTEGQLRALALAGAWTLLIIAVVRLTSHAVLLSGSLGALRAGDFGDLIIGSTFGRGWLLQVVTLIALLAWLRPQTPSWSALLYGSGALAISASFLGHPAAVSDVPLIAMSVDAVHGLTAGGWAGGIVMLAVAALPQLRSVPAGDRLDVARSVLGAFSPFALACAAIIVMTGAIGAWLQMRDVGLVLGSEYGRMLVRKVVAVALIVALGAFHWKVVLPAVDSERSIGRLRVSLAFDIGLVLLVLAFTAVLTGTAPPVR